MKPANRLTRFDRKQSHTTKNGKTKMIARAKFAKQRPINDERLATPGATLNSWVLA
jgi:hypothetical protein